MEKKNITIAGAGLVGSLLSSMLAKRGYNVTLFERRPDMRSADISAGKSINLAMSDRGLRALEMAGLAEQIRRIAIPMKGRVMHGVDGGTTFQPYGVEGQFINSVSRGQLNMELMTLAEQSGVQIHFNSKCVDIDLETATATFENYESGQQSTVESDILIGADGAFSVVRAHMQTTDGFDYSQSYLDHSYKELEIPAGEGGAFRIEKNALHIWPRKSFMIIALPNIDGSYTVTLFLARKGSPSFSEIETREDVKAFFDEHFPDAVQHMPTLVDDFMQNPTSSLVTVKCKPWVMNGHVALIGDAAHAIVPFYGQGMNCGFEDCRVLIDCLEYCNDDWDKALPMYESYRIKDANAIADLAVENFVEMRDKVADERFLRRKKIEAYICVLYPTKFIPQYTLVTFSDNVPFSEARRVGQEQDAVMQELMAHDVVYNDWTSAEARSVIDEVMATREDLKFAPISPL